MVKHSALQVAVVAALFGTAANADFGIDMQTQLETDAYDLFGVTAPLAASASTHTARVAGQSGSDLVDVAGGLTATILTRDAGQHLDMMAFWPATNPTHLIGCIEGTRSFVTNGNGDGILDAGDKLNPSVQSIDLNTGAVTTLLRGMSRCDGIRTTDWGTVLATEEADDGGAYELLLPTDPTTFVEASIADRASGNIVLSSDAVTLATEVVKRTDMPTMAWEGLTVLASGVVIGGDELRPGDDNGVGSDGGALFKFVPTVPRTATGHITALNQSPLAAGSTYALQVSCNSGDQTFGQGCEVGNGAWVAVNAATARTDANVNGATGYYRPEDLHTDPTYTGTGVRFCWTNTGRESAGHYGEVMCGIDSDPTAADANTRSVVVNRFVEGDTELNSVDNLAFQPVSGNLYVIEDHDNGDVWACLPDGRDRDIRTDGCVRILSVKDQSAEPTGFMFDAAGTTAYVAIQHSDDNAFNVLDGYDTDDLVKITGFKLPQ